MSEGISIYIPAYNAEKTIEFSINSILEQTVKIDEIIVVIMRKTITSRNRRQSWKLVHTRTNRYYLSPK